MYGLYHIVGIFGRDKVRQMSNNLLIHPNFYDSHKFMISSHDYLQGEENVNFKVFIEWTKLPANPSGLLSKIIPLSPLTCPRLLCTHDVHRIIDSTARYIHTTHHNVTFTIRHIGLHMIYFMFSCKIATGTFHQFFSQNIVML